MEFQLHYTEQGQGTPFVLLHGNGESSDYFSHQIEHFSMTYRVIAVDTRGHGNLQGRRSFTLEQFVEDLKQLLDYLELKRLFCWVLVTAVTLR
ncbi:MAG: alpha/beta fold hydrolase [Acutalibacteraceae bacterium]